MSEAWRIEGELILNCSCTVFCPCVISLGKHPPTEEHCQGWAGIHIDEGRYGGAGLDGLNVGLLLDIPGSMGRGNWTAAAYLDERADAAALEGLTRIFTGQAGGTTGLLTVLVGTFLGVQTVPIVYEKKGKVRHFSIPKKIDGAIEPITGSEEGEDVVIKNTQYWIAPDIVVSQALKSRVRDFGRVWDFGGRSAELCRIDWSGP